MSTATDSTMEKPLYKKNGFILGMVLVGIAILVAASIAIYKLSLPTTPPSKNNDDGEDKSFKGQRVFR